MVAAFAALPAILFRRVLFGGESFFSRDIAPFFYPMKHFLAETVRAGVFPLWNPGVLNGEPFFATLQPGVFYPGSVLLYLLPLPAALDLLTVAHYPLAGAGTYLLLRRWGSRRAAALTGGVAFMLGGYFASVGNFTNNLQTVAWIPWVLFAWDRFLATGRGREALWFSAACAVAFLGGEPQMLALGLGLGLVHGLVRVEGRGLPAGRQVAAFAAAGALALGVVAVQLLPFLELVGHSVRTLGPDLEFATRQTLEPAGLLQLLLPPALGAGVHGFTGRYVLTPEPSWLVSIYPGCVVLALALAGASWPKSRRWIAFWGGVAVVGIVLALGVHTPVYGALFGALPPLRLVRYPEKFLFLTALALAVLSARGVEGALREDVRKRVLWAAGAVAAAEVAVLLGLRLAGGSLAPACASFLAGAAACDAPAEAAALHGGLALRTAALATALFFVVGLARRLSAPVLAAATVSLVAADLLVAADPVNPSVDRDLYRRPAWARQVLSRAAGAEGSYRYRGTPLSAAMGGMAKVTGALELSNLYLYYESAGPNLGQVQGLLLQDGLQGLELTSVARGFDFALHNRGQAAANLLRAASVKYYADPTALPDSVAALEPFARHPELPIRLWRVEDPVPRAYVVGRYVVEEEPVEAFRAVLRPGFPLHSTVVLDRAPDRAPAPGARGRVLSAEYGVNRVDLTVAADRPALLVLTDRHFPGWRAAVDGEEAPIRLANGQFRAVSVPPGRHRVSFRFAPASVRAGGWLSAVSGFFFLFGVATTRRREGTSTCREGDGAVARHLGAAT